MDIFRDAMQKILDWALLSYLSNKKVWLGVCDWLIETDPPRLKASEAK